MRWWGGSLDRDEVRQRLGNMDQLAGICPFSFDDGRARPGRAARVWTGAGLEFTVNLDRCMDITAASFMGVPLAWRSPVGDVAPQYFEPEGARWLRSFCGGLLATCGLINVGAPEEGSELTGRGIHGRIGNTPAQDIQVSQEWEEDDYVLRLRGSMREAALFGENLLLNRSIETWMGARRIIVEDILTNEGFHPQTFQFLYHCNIGWPSVDEGAEVLAPSRAVAPRDEEARDGADEWANLDAPTPEYLEKAYYHDMVADDDGIVECAVYNPNFDNGRGFGVLVRYEQKNLPRFTYWKQMGEQAYVVGLEPCNCGVEGRSVDEQYGLLHVLEPGQSLRYRIEFEPLLPGEPVERLRKRCNAQETRIVDSYRKFV